jgi:hypothetical protein
LNKINYFAIIAAMEERKIIDLEKYRRNRNILPLKNKVKGREKLLIGRVLLVAEMVGFPTAAILTHNEALVHAGGVAGITLILGELFRTCNTSTPKPQPH